MEEKRFAVFILSHGRANEILTVDMLKNFHYTGDWYVVIDNEDDQESIYREKFGEHILQFDKIEYAEKTDTGDLENDRRVGVFACNAIQDFAYDMGYKYHLQLDDDFRDIRIRLPIPGKKTSLSCPVVKDLDRLFDAMLDFMDTTPVAWLTFNLSSGYLGGSQNASYKKGLVPKCMGSFLMRRDQRIYFRMRMNDDIITCVSTWMVGIPNYTVAKLQVSTPETQKMKGGMTDIYVDNGTYRKSFYSVMTNPSCEKVAKQGITHFRIHHQTAWENCAPKVLDEKWRKARPDNAEV